MGSLLHSSPARYPRKQVFTDPSFRSGYNFKPLRWNLHEGKQESQPASKKKTDKWLSSCKSPFLSFLPTSQVDIDRTWMKLFIIILKKIAEIKKKDTNQWSSSPLSLIKEELNCCGLPMWGTKTFLVILGFFTCSFFKVWSKALWNLL